MVKSRTQREIKAIYTSTLRMICSELISEILYSLLLLLFACSCTYVLGQCLLSLSCLHACLDPHF